MFIRQHIALFFILCFHALTLSTHAADSQSKQLLRDPRLLHGITQGYANHLPATERADCLTRWQSKGLTNAQWAFWEISEQLHFAHHRETPTVKAPGEFIWQTTNLAKQCLLEKGRVHLLYDTGKEWREGGALNLPDKSGKPPKYGNPHTVWPHFLIGQHFAKDNNPLTIIPDAEKLTFEKYDRLRLQAKVKLNRLVRSSTWDHSSDYKAPNHAIFYFAIVIMPKTANRVADGGKFYMLVPAIYSEGDNRHVPGSTPWLGLDQFGDGVYFSGSQPTLEAGRKISYDIDVKQLIREGLSAATQRSFQHGKRRIYRAEDYFLACLLVGWEVWGGFDTDIEFSDLSLTGTTK
ncbi:MAG TPA: hypothetical protein VGH19_13140 [Verrucomicrobiae bacterium]